MLPFQAELYRTIFPHHIAQSRTEKIVQDKAQGSGHEGAYFVYATERTGSCNAVIGDFSAIISAQSRTEKNLSEQGVGFCE